MPLPDAIATAIPINSSHETFDNLEADRFRLADDRFKSCNSSKLQVRCVNERAEQNLTEMCEHWTSIRLIIPCFWFLTLLGDGRLLAQALLGYETEVPAEVKTTLEAWCLLHGKEASVEQCLKLVREEPVTLAAKLWAEHYHINVFPEVFGGMTTTWRLYKAF